MKALIWMYVLHFAGQLWRNLFLIIMLTAMLAKESKPKRFEYKNCQDLLSGIIRENEIRKIYI